MQYWKKASVETEGGGGDDLPPGTERKNRRLPLFQERQTGIYFFSDLYTLLQCGLTELGLHEQVL